MIRSNYSWSYAVRRRWAKTQVEVLVLTEDTRRVFMIVVDNDGHDHQIYVDMAGLPLDWMIFVPAAQGFLLGE